MARIRTQLAIQVSPELLARLKGAATAQGRTLTAVCLDWLEAGLAGAVAAPTGGELLARLDAMEARLKRLEAPAAPAMPLPPPAAPLVSTGERLTTADLSRATGTSAGAWNSWAAGHAPGDVRWHTTAGSWRLLGKEAPPPDVGGPARWVWEKVV